MGMAASRKGLLASHRDQLKPEVVWNIEKGLSLTMEDIAAAELARGRLYHRVRQFYETFDLVLCPATVVPPYPVEQRYVEECQGHRFSNYIRSEEHTSELQSLMRISYAVFCLKKKTTNYSKNPNQATMSTSTPTTNTTTH